MLSSLYTCVHRTVATFFNSFYLLIFSGSATYVLPIEVPALKLATGQEEFIWTNRLEGKQCACRDEVLS